MESLRITSETELFYSQIKKEEKVEESTLIIDISPIKQVNQDKSLMSGEQPLQLPMQKMEKEEDCDDDDQYIKEIQENYKIPFNNTEQTEIKEKDQILTDRTDQSKAEAKEMVVPCNFDKLMTIGTTQSPEKNEEKPISISPRETRNHQKPKFDLKLGEKKLNETAPEMNSSARKKVTFIEEKKVINYEDKKNVQNFCSYFEGEVKEDYANSLVIRKSSSKKKKPKPILVKKKFDHDLIGEENPTNNSLKIKKKVTPIILRNIKEIGQIETTYKKTGQKTVLKERKKVQKKKDALCEKFAKDPLKFFTSPTKSYEVEDLPRPKPKDKVITLKKDHLRNCNSEKMINNKPNRNFEIIQSLRYDNLSRQEKEHILKDLITKLNIESPNSQVENKTEDNIVNISYMSENDQKN